MLLTVVFKFLAGHVPYIMAHDGFGRDCAAHGEVYPSILE